MPPELATSTYIINHITRQLQGEWATTLQAAGTERPHRATPAAAAAPLPRHSICTEKNFGSVQRVVCNELEDTEACVQREMVMLKGQRDESPLQMPHASTLPLSQHERSGVSTPCDREPPNFCLYIIVISFARPCAQLTLSHRTVNDQELQHRKGVGAHPTAFTISCNDNSRTLTDTACIKHQGCWAAFPGCIHDCTRDTALSRGCNNPTFTACSIF